ncbi:MAG: 3-oxoacyl-ACP reductase FabG [Lysobacterales bacterium]
MSEVRAKLAVVTGASRGIGAAIADHLAAAGLFVVGTATSQAGADAISARLGAQGTGRVLDVADATAIDAFVSAVEAEFGAVYALVNNAGITRDQLLLRMKDEDFLAVIQTNLASVFRLSKAVLKRMLREREGRIVNIASVIGLTGNAGQANYAAAKAGIIGFTKSLAREVGSRGITANVVAPGFIDTDMTRALPDAQRQSMLTDIPLARLGSAADIAGAVAFLVSPAAAYITGETLHVNGGMYMP